MLQRTPLEPAALQVALANSMPPFIFQLPPSEGREVLNKAQDTPVYKYPATINSVPVNLGKWGNIMLYVVTPQNTTTPHNIIFYMHGAGWVFGNFHTHEKLVRELAARTNSVVVFPEYSLSPEVKYPVAIEQCYAVLNMLPSLAKQLNLNVRFDTLTVAGDSVGGNMAAVMAILAKTRNGIKIHKQLLYYPVTNAYFDTDSYKEFATGYYLQREGMMWFWDQYTTSEKDRDEIAASPLRATVEQLRGLPNAMVIVGEADVLRDEGEAYARKLLEAGVDVTSIRFNGIIHDFVMLNALDQTNATRAAMDVSTEWLNRKNAQAAHEIKIAAVG